MRKLMSLLPTLGRVTGDAATERRVQQITGLVLVPLPALCAYFVSHNGLWWVLGALSLLLAVLVSFSHRLPASTRDYLLSFCFIGHCILLTSALSGHPWQLDSHMMFFASLAVVSTLANPKALIFATVLVALHHASFSLAMPSLVYPNGGLVENLQRTAFHAAIVLLESGVLLISMKKGLQADAALLRQQQAAEEQARAAQSSEAQATQARQDAERVVDTFGERLAELAEGKLTCSIDETFPPAYTQLQDNFNYTVETLRGTIEQVLMVTGSINDGVSEISRASDDLSNRSENQAATLEQTAAALDQMTASVRSAAEAVKDVENTMEEARVEAKNSGEIVHTAVSAMSAIQNSSSQIARIVSVIDDIAFQTNLLALNAGVEAARAGEAGKGFAVVASEVRGLAQRSAEAATEIKTLIGESSEHVHKGFSLVGKAGQAFEKIVEQVTHISGLVANISKGAAEQAIGISEINTGVSQLDQVTQQNAAMVAETKEAGHILSSNSQTLAELMARFETHDPSQTETTKAA